MNLWNLPVNFFIFDLNNFLLTNLFTHFFSEYFKQGSISSLQIFGSWQFFLVFLVKHWFKLVWLRDLIMRRRYQALKSFWKTQARKQILQPSTLLILYIILTFLQVGKFQSKVSVKWKLKTIELKHMLPFSTRCSEIQIYQTIATLKLVSYFNTSNNLSDYQLSNEYII